MTNPYESPATSNNPSHDDRRAWVAMIPLLIAIPGVIIAAFLGFCRPLPFVYNNIALGIVAAVLVYDIPVCALVVVEWLRTGEPPELSLSPLIPSRVEREFRRTLCSRPELGDDDFYATFYADSQIPKSLVVRLRKSLECAFGLDFAGLHPADNLIVADGELDWADVLFRLNREFGITLTREMLANFDGTFDNLAKLIYRQSKSANRRDV
jgi:hypothetical protein